MGERHIDQMTVRLMGFMPGAKVFWSYQLDDDTIRVIETCHDQPGVAEPDPAEAITKVKCYTLPSDSPHWDRVVCKYELDFTDRVFNAILACDAKPGILNCDVEAMRQTASKETAVPQPDDVHEFHRRRFDQAKKIAAYAST